jgi:hypothetical protein
MQPSSSLTPYVSSNMRYLAARITAGFSDIALAAELMGIPLDEYMGFEDIFGAPLETTQLVARTYGVSVDYLIGSHVITHRDELAQIIAQGLAHHRASLPIVKSSVFEARKLASALVAIRKFKGFKTPAAAAAAMSWPALLYTAHEELARPLTPELLATYALQYQVRPDTALRGEEPVPLWHDLEYPWWRLQTRGEHVATVGLVSPSFDWLADGSSASTYLNLPLLEYSGERWEVSRVRFPLSRQLLPAATGVVGDTLFGLVDRVSEEVRVIIVDPTRAGMDSIQVAQNGDIRIEPETSDIALDPTHHRPKRKSDYFSIGAFVSEVTVRSLMS